MAALRAAMMTCEDSRFDPRRGEPRPRERASEPSSMRLATATAVKPFVPLAMANCVSTVFEIS